MADSSAVCLFRSQVLLPHAQHPFVASRSSWTNKLITAKDHAAVQLNIGHLNEEGVYTGQFSTFALAGSVRGQVSRRAQHARHSVVCMSRRCLAGRSSAPQCPQQRANAGTWVQCVDVTQVVHGSCRTQREGGRGCHEFAPALPFGTRLQAKPPKSDEGCEILVSVCPWSQGEADSAIDLLWQKKRQEVSQ